jgi:nitrilase
MPSARNLVICTVQQAPVFLNLSASVDLAVSIIEEAANNGAKLIVFPETWLPGYPVWLDYAPRAAIWDEPGATALFGILFDNSIRLNDAHADRLQAAADDAQVNVVMGANERIEGTIYNSILYFVPDIPVTTHRKLMPTYSERMVWGRGDGSTLAVVETKQGRIGGLICWEHWMPLARAAMHELAEDIHVALWPYVKEMNLVASRHYAFEGRCIVVAAGCLLNLSQAIEGCESVGSADGQAAADMLREIGESADLPLLRGGSAVIAPDGSFISEPDQTGSKLVYTTVNLDQRRNELLTMDVSGHYSRPDVFQLRVDTSVHANVRFIAADETGRDDGQSN